MQLNSAVVFNAIWFFLSFAACVLHLPKSIDAFSFILLCSSIFTIMYILVSSLQDYRLPCISVNCGLSQAEKKCEKEIPYWNTAVICLNVIGVVVLFNSLGFSASSFRSVENLMNSMNAVSKARYSGNEEILPVFNRIVNAIVYATCGYNGFFYVINKRKAHFINLLLVMFQTVLTNTKATLVFGMAFWIAGYLTGLRYLKEKINHKKLFYGIVLLAGLLVFFTGVNFFRHKGTMDVAVEFKRIMISYLIGPFSALNIWLESLYDYSIELGANTFSCLFRVLGIKAQEHGEFVMVYDDLSTNVFTVFKHLLRDYSFLGTYLLMLFTGLICAIVDYKISRKQYSFVGVSIVLYTSIIVAFFSSLYRYTTNLLACILIIVLFLPYRIVVK